MSVSQPFQPQGLLALSDEILVLVLSFLQDGHLLACCQTSQRFRKLATDRSLVRRLNFRRDVLVTRENWKYFFSSPQTCQLVHSLNLNGLYWMPASSIHAQVVKMRNIRELHVGDILFSARQFASLISRLSQLRQLSLSWPWLEVEEVEEITTGPGLASVYQQLEQLNIFLAVGDRCPLDKVTWLLAQCRDLRQLAILSQVLHSEVRSSVNKYNIVISTRQFNLPVLASVVWEIRNETFPSLLEREILSRLRSQCPHVLTKTTQFFSRQEDGVAVHDIRHQLEPDECVLLGCLVKQNILVSSHTKESLVPSREIWGDLRELSIDHALYSPGLLTSLEKLTCILSQCHNEESQKFVRQLFRENPKKLKHLELRRDSERNICVDLVLKELVSTAPALQTLVLSDVEISARQSQILASLLQTCSNLSHLQLTNLQSADQRLFADLQKGLLAAKQLKLLQIHQKQLTQHSGRLLDSLADNCDNIQQVVLIDPSRAFNLKKFPTENVIKLVQKQSMRFFYLCSELLTVNDKKILKRSLRTLMVSKPHLLVKLQSTLACPPGSSTSPFYSLEDIQDLPMEYQRVVASCAGDYQYRYDNTSVTRLTVDDVF